VARVHSGAEKGNLRATTGESGAAGILPNAHFQDEHVQGISITKAFWIDVAGVSGSDRCYEPFGTQFGVAIPLSRGATILEVLYHELITNS
jgi:hypothetical protein